MAGAEVARGDAMSDLPKRAPRLRPELDDLGAFEPVDLPEALTRWMAWARAATRDQAMTADDVTPPDRPGARPAAAAEGPARRGRRPLDRVAADQPADRLQPAAAHPLAGAGQGRAAARPPGCRSPPETVLEPMPAKGTVEDYEQAAAAARDAQTLLRSFPDVAGLTSEDAALVEDACATRITELLPDAITLSASGTLRGLRHRDRAVVQHLPRLLGAGRQARSAPTTCTATTPARSTASTSDPRRRPPGAHRRPRRRLRPAQPEDRYRTRDRRTTRPPLPPPLIRATQGSPGRRAEAIGL